MKKYLLKRLLRLIPVFLGVTILAFLLTGLSSVDAVDLKESSSGGVMSEAEKEAMREELGLNEPKAVQYLQWLKNALRGDFGESYVSGKPVLVSFREKLQNIRIRGRTAVSACSALQVIRFRGFSLHFFSCISFR